EEGRDEDLWDDRENNEHRKKAFSNEGGGGDQHGDDEAADDGEKKSEHGQIERGPQMRKQQITALRHPFQYRRWRRQYDAADAHCSNADLPSQEDERRDEEWPRDGGGRRGMPLHGCCG